MVIDRAATSVATFATLGAAALLVSGAQVRVHNSNVAVPRESTAHCPAALQAKRRARGRAAAALAGCDETAAAASGGADRGASTGARRTQLLQLSAM